MATAMKFLPTAHSGKVHSSFHSHSTFTVAFFHFSSFFSFLSQQYTNHIYSTYLSKCPQSGKCPPLSIKHPPSLPFLYMYCTKILSLISIKQEFPYQGMKLHLIQVPMRLNFSLWRPNPESQSPNWQLERFIVTLPRDIENLKNLQR